MLATARLRPVRGGRQCTDVKPKPVAEEALLHIAGSGLGTHGAQVRRRADYDRDRPAWVSRYTTRAGRQPLPVDGPSEIRRRASFERQDAEQSGDATAERPPQLPKTAGQAAAIVATIVHLLLARKQVEGLPEQRNRRSGALRDRLQNRHALHVVRHREQVERPQRAGPGSPPSVKYAEVPGQRRRVAGHVGDAAGAQATPGAGPSACPRRRAAGRGRSGRPR